MSTGFDSGFPSSGFGDDSFQSSITSSPDDKEIKLAIQQLQTQAEFQSQLHQLTSRCWDLCYSGAPGAKFDDKRANCLKNCADRYMDTSIFLRKRLQEYASRIQQQQQ